MKIHIQSLSDIITNSSSETFSVLKDDSVESVKLIIDSILDLAGHGFHWDDFFKIEEGFDEEDARRRHRDEWDYNDHEEGETYTEPNREELIDFVHDYNEDRLNDSEGALIETYLTFVPIDPDADESAKLLHKLNDLFESQTQYC